MVAVLFGVSGLKSLIGLANGAARMRHLEGKEGRIPVQTSGQASWVRAINVVSFPLTVLLVVLFLVWFSGTYRAALARRGDHHGGTGARTALWLVPVLNLFVCFGPVATIWDAGRPGREEDDGRGLLLAWWIAGSAAVMASVVGVVVAISSFMAGFREAMDAAQRGVDPKTTVITMTVANQRMLLVLGLAGALLTATAAFSAAAFVLVSSHRLGGAPNLAARLAPVSARVITSCIVVTVLGLATVFVLIGQ
jgi:hypothetical protein